MILAIRNKVQETNKITDVFFSYNSPLATDSHTQWYAIELLFFLSCVSGAVVFEIADWLSPNKYDGPDMGTPIVRNLYRSPL
jgi:hypothetical protein